MKQTTTQKQVREIRSKTGKSQAAFAAAYGIPRRTVENWESGVNEPPAYVIGLLRRAVQADVIRQNKIQNEDVPAVDKKTRG